MTEVAVLCVYYKVAAAHHAATALQVRQFQATLSTAWPRLVCELLQRPEAAAGVETWMETYRDHQDQDLGTAVVAHIAQAAAAADLPTPRHSERFITLR